MHQLLLEEFEERRSPFPVFEVTWGNPIFSAQVLKAPQECTVFTMVNNRNRQSKSGLGFEAVVGRKNVSRISNLGCKQIWVYLTIKMSLANNSETWQRNHQHCCSDNLHSSTNREDPQHSFKNASKRTRPCSHRNTLFNAHRKTRFIVVLHFTKNSHLYTQ